MIENLKRNGKLNRFKIGDIIIEFIYLTDIQQKLLNEKAIHFLDCPTDFVPILDYILVGDFKDKIIAEFQNDIVFKNTLVNLICNDCNINNDPEYYILKTIDEINKDITKPTFVLKKILIEYGYKYLDISKLSQAELVEIALYESALRGVNEMFAVIDSLNQICNSDELNNLIIKYNENIKQQGINKIKQNPNIKTGIGGLTDL